MTKISSEADIKFIRHQSAASEAKGMLTEDLLQLAYDRKWFKLLVPSKYGGLQIPLPQLVALQEALAYADGSFSWTITLCSGAGWFGGFMQDCTATKFIANNNICLAGSGMATGTAEITGNGFVVNGDWLYASGALHASGFTANCVITQNGLPLKDANCNKIIRPFVFTPQEIQLVHNWKSSGMIATGSHGFTIENLFVEHNRAYDLVAEKATDTGLLYRYPFLQLAEATLAVNLSGIALHFLEEAAAIIGKRVNSGSIPMIAADAVSALLHNSKTALDKCRQQLFDSVALSWDAFEVNDNNVDLLTAVSHTSRALAAQARASVEAIYPHCGIEASVFNTPINRAWRDLHTASQHSLLLYERK